MVDAIIGFIIKMFEILPQKILFPLLTFLTSTFGRFDAKHRNIAKINMDIAFPDLSEEEKEELVTRAYRNLGRTIAEIIKIGHYDSSYIMKKVNIEGLDNIMGAYEKGKGVFAVTGHFGNWELMAYTFGKRVTPIDVIVRPQGNDFIDSYIDRKRVSGGNRVITKFNSAREVIRRIKNGRIIGVLMDQDSSVRTGTFVDFFGLPACTLDAVPRIAYKTGASIVPVFIFRDREKPQCHQIKFLKPITPHAEIKEDYIREALININGCIENVIKEQPEQWLWFHRRWRTRPEGENRIYDI